jgi:TolA-binding protein
LDVAQATIAALQMGRSDKEKVIAGYDVQLEETDRELMRTQSTVADQAWRIGDLEQRLRQSSERLAFLEGYYEKSQETVSTISPIRSAGSPITSDPAEAQTGGRPRDQEGLSAGRQRSQGAGLDQGAAGARSRLGDPLWRQQAHDSTNPEGRPLEHIEINDGISRERFGL